MQIIEKPIEEIQPYEDNPRHNEGAVESSKKVLRVCKNCGVEFYVYRSALEKSNASGNFCCRKCYNEAQKGFTGEKNNHYSSKTVLCAQCGKEIRRTASKIQAYKNSFCNHECRGKYLHHYIGGNKNCNWRGGLTTNKGDFATVKRLHFSGLQFCAICGATKAIHIHHIIPYRYTQDNSTGNLIPLCAKHHKMVEAASDKVLRLCTDYETAKLILAGILRTYQMATFENLRQIAAGVNHGNC